MAHWPRPRGSGFGPCALVLLILGAPSAATTAPRDQPHLRVLGQIEEVKLVSPSGVAEFDASSNRAIASSSPTQPLSREYPQDRCFFTLKFFYNTPQR